MNRPLLPFLMVFFTFATLLLTQQGSCDLVCFEFADPSGTNQAGADLNGLSSGSSSLINADGVTITLNATASSGTFQQAFPAPPSVAPNFGIDSGTGGPATIDNNEFMNFSFTASAPVTITLTEIVFERFGAAGGDVGSLSLLPSSFDSTDLTSSALAINTVVGAGQAISLGYLAGNGYGIELIKIDVQLATVPEPSSMLYGMLVMGILGVARKFTSCRSMFSDVH